VPEPSNFRERWLTEEEQLVEGDAMQNPATFRAYAEECKRLAASMPEHKDALLQMAQAWMTCAENAERAKGARLRPD
jgi:hypothetical protein